MWWRRGRHRRKPLQDKASTPGEVCVATCGTSTTPFGGLGPWAHNTHVAEPYHVKSRGKGNRKRR